MADALASGASVRKDVGVQVPPSAPRIVLKSLNFSTFFCPEKDHRSENPLCTEKREIKQKPPGKAVELTVFEEM